MSQGLGLEKSQVPLKVMLILRRTRHYLYEIHTSFLTEISEIMEASGTDVISIQGIYTCIYMYMEL